MNDYMLLATVGLFGSVVLSLFLLAKGRMELWILTTFLVVIVMLILHSDPNAVVQGVNRANG